MKILSRDITHKSDAGGVRLDLNTRDAVRRGFTELMNSARTKHFPRQSLTV
jgi:acyl-CoA synthetase (NDP forming)